MRISPDSELSAGTKKVLFSSSALIDQRFLQFINKVLINYKDRVLDPDCLRYAGKLFKKTT